MKPSTDQVFQNTFIGLGFLVRCVSRSAMWMPLTPAFFISLAQPSRSSCAGSLKSMPRSLARLTSACLTNQDTMPGLAPQRRPRSCRPGCLRFSARTRLAQRIVGARGVVGLLVEIEAEPGLDDRVDVEHAELAAELHQVERAGVDRQVDAEALAAALGQQRRQQLLVVLLGHRVLDEGDAALVEQLPVGVARVDDRHARLVELEMALDQRQRSAADRAEADHHDRAGDLAVDGPVLFRHFGQHSAVVAH